MGTHRRNLVLESRVRLVEMERVFRPSASVTAGVSFGTIPAVSSATVFGSAVIVSCLCVKERMCGCSGLCVNECAVWGVP